MNSRIPLIYRIQELDKEIWKAWHDLFTTEEQIFQMHHRRAELQDKYDYFMTPWRD